MLMVASLSKIKFNKNILVVTFTSEKFFCVVDLYNKGEIND